MRQECYGLKRTVDPAAEPVLAADVRTWGEIADTTGEYADAVITDRIKSARELLEDQANVSLITQTWAMYLDRFPLGVNGTYGFGDGGYYGYGSVIQLVRGPWQSITSIQYVDVNGVTQTVSSSVYTVDLIRGRITPAFGQVWPPVRPQVNAITITFVSGYGAAGSNCPARAREILLEITVDRFKNRSGVFAIGAGTMEKIWGLWPGKL